jgi:hypothetical protein
MARGQQQYPREAKQMGRINLDENEFDTFSEDYPFVKFGRKGGIFKRMKSCLESAKKSGIGGRAKKSFISNCMKIKAKEDAKAIKTKGGKLKKRNLEKLFQSQLAQKRSGKPITKGITPPPKPQQRKADPSLTAPKGDDPQIQADTKKKKLMKLLMFGGIGVVILIIGIKLIKK